MHGAGRVKNTYILYSIRGIFRTQSNIYDGAFYENNYRYLAINYFRKKPHLKCLISL